MQGQATPLRTVPAISWPWHRRGGGNHLQPNRKGLRGPWVVGAKSAAPPPSFSHPKQVPPLRCRGEEEAAFFTVKEGGRLGKRKSGRPCLRPPPFTSSP